MTLRLYSGANPLTSPIAACVPVFDGQPLYPSPRSARRQPPSPIITSVDSFRGALNPAHPPGNTPGHARFEENCPGDRLKPPMA